MIIKLIKNWLKNYMLHEKLMNDFSSVFEKNPKIKRFNYKLTENDIKLLLACYTYGITNEKTFSDQIMKGQKKPCPFCQNAKDYENDIQKKQNNCAELLNAVIFFVESTCFECPKELDDNGDEVKKCSEDCNIRQYKDLLKKKE